MSDSIQQEARQILDTLAFAPFEQCLPLSRDFANLPSRPGLYALTSSAPYKCGDSSPRRNLRIGERSLNGVDTSQIVACASKSYTISMSVLNLGLPARD